jgi:hypothetical protein
MGDINVHLAQRFIQMLPGDVALWQRFLVQHGEYYDRFDYNIHVGEGVPLDPSWPENIRVAAKSLTTKRIDAVGYRGSEVWIFEVKPDAGLGALGQLLAYEALWIREGRLPVPTHLAIITDRLNPDEEYLFKLHGIRTFIVIP